MVKVNRILHRKRKNYRCKLVDEPFIGKNGDKYEGMNFYAARELGIPYPYQSHTVCCWKGHSNPRARVQIFNHEIEEAEKMRKGLAYPQAHGETSEKDAQNDINRTHKPVDQSEYVNASYLWEDKS